MKIKIYKNRGIAMPDATNVGVRFSFIRCLKNFLKKLYENY